MPRGGKYYQPECNMLISGKLIPASELLAKVVQFSVELSHA